MFWLVVPRLIKENEIREIIRIMLLIFLFQFLPKVYHSITLMRRMAKVTGYIFGTIWWGFALNLIAYFIASHVLTFLFLPCLSFQYYYKINVTNYLQVAGGCWYVLSIQRVAMCLNQRCHDNRSLSCSASHFANATASSSSSSSSSLCLDVDGPFQYGIYKWALPVVSSTSIAVKILYPIFWGLMTLRYSVTDSILTE